MGRGETRRTSAKHVTTPFSNALRVMICLQLSPAFIMLKRASTWLMHSATFSVAMSFPADARDIAGVDADLSPRTMLPC